MSNEFYVECYLKGSAGAVKLSEMACERDPAAWARLAKTLTATYRPKDAGKIELRTRRISGEDAVGVAQGLEGELADAWWAACRGILQ